jgi:hypothetical protein
MHQIRYFLSISMIALMAPCTESVWATSPPPVWSRQPETTESLQAKGFTFVISTLPRHLYKKNTIEIVVDAPTAFVFQGMTNHYSAMLLINDDIAVDLDTVPKAEKRHAVITISQRAAKTSQLLFYYKNATKGVTDGTQYALSLDNLMRERVKQRKSKQ